jgi:transposase InsO family protein
VSIIEWMVIDMNEVQVRTVEQVRQVLAGTQALEFRAAEDDEGRYRWIEAVLWRLDYRVLGRADRGAVLAYVQRLSGYSRAQVTRLVSRWVAGRPLMKSYRAPRHAFARRYTTADIELLAEVDRAMGTLSGPATACVLRRQRDVFGDERFDRLGSISVAHLYNLRKAAGYRAQRVVLTKTRGDKSAAIGVRRAPAPDGRPGFVRIDSVHQGDHDGIKGVYHINAVDCVTQWEVVASVQTISEAHLLPVIEHMLEQFPFEILGFHADNGSEYVNHRVARLLDKLRIEFTRSRPRTSKDNALAETKNGAVVRKVFGYGHIPQRHASRFNTFCVEYLNPFLNFHRPCLFPTEVPDTKKPGRFKRVYRPRDVMTELPAVFRLPRVDG